LLHFDTCNAGIREAYAELAALVDSDCIAAPDWLEQMAMRQCDSNATVGGVVDDGARERALDWAGYVPIHREWFDRFGPFREVIYRTDTALHSTPLLVLGLAAWSLGEMRGYLGSD
jgi:GT2 family glycosyltransferase